MDVLVGKNLNSVSKIKELNEIGEDDLILDIGPKTINAIKKLVENSETVLWNGHRITSQKQSAQHRPQTAKHNHQLSMEFTRIQMCRV